VPDRNQPNAAFDIVSRDWDPPEPSCFRETPQMPVDPVPSGTYDPGPPPLLAHTDDDED
jgi:hypothetical protein